MLFVQPGKLETAVVDQFVDTVATVSEVRGVFLMSGRADLVVHVVVRDMQHLKEIISEHFNREAAALRVDTSVVFERRQQSTMPIALP